MKKKTGKNKFIKKNKKKKPGKTLKKKKNYPPQKKGRRANLQLMEWYELE